MKTHKSIFILIFLLFFTACKSLPGGDARKNPPQPELRVKKNLEEGKGFRIDNLMTGSGNGTFDFASSNELWRASLDTVDFMPLVSANYSGGIIITDWYSEQPNESIKITLRFLSNEVRSDAIDVKIFYKKCDQLMNCVVRENDGNLKQEIKKEILKKAAVYKKQNQDKNFKPYDVTDLKD